MTAVLVLVSSLLLTITNGQQRILNSETASDGDFPYQALIYDYSTYCGGSIIHERWALTVAHCTYKNYANLNVFVGTNKNLGSGGTAYPVERIIRHERRLFKTNLVLNDIALVRTAYNIKFNSRVQPIKLASNIWNNFENAWATISGWGKLYPGNTVTFLPRNLRFARVRVLEQAECRRQWPTVSDNSICTSTDEGISTCQGDSGDPLVADGLQIGIASYADGECGKRKPTVHTRVTSFITWIARKMEIYSDRLL